MTLKTVACLVVAVLNTVAMAQTPSQLSSSVVGRDSALVDWPQFQFDAAHTGYNPYEVILSPQTVGNLLLAWQTQGKCEDLRRADTYG